MRLPKILKLAIVFFMSTLMTNLPAVAAADGQMISTSQVLNELNRAQAQRQVEEFLQQSNVRQQLIDQGLSPDEVSQRLASLSETELRQLSGQIQEARAGGDILVTILIVVLIIFLIKRI